MVPKSREKSMWEEASVYSELEATSFESLRGLKNSKAIFSLQNQDLHLIIKRLKTCKPHSGCERPEAETPVPGACSDLHWGLGIGTCSVCTGLGIRSSGIGA